jgi:hypothetical protein
VQAAFGTMNPDNRADGRAVGRFLVLAGGFVFILFAGWIVLTMSEVGGLAIVRWLFGSGAGDTAVAGLRQSVLNAFLVGATAVGLAAYHLRSGRPWLQIVVVAVLLVDLVTAGLAVSPCVPDALLTEPSATFGLISSELGNGRMYRTANSDNVGLQAKSDHVAWRFRYVLDVLGWWTPILARIPRVFDDDLMLLSPLSMMQLKYLVEQLPWHERASILGAAGVTVVYSDERFETPRLEYVGEVPNRGGQSYALYRNLMAVPLVRMATSWRVFSSEDAMLAAMTDQAYDPRQIAFILDQLDDRHEGPKAPISSTITPILDRIHVAEYEVQTAHDGYLVFSESFYPGWQIKIDGQPASIYRADYAFSAVFLEAGHHRVRRSYLPVTLLIGGIVSSLFLALLIPGFDRLLPGSASPRKP